MTPPIEVVTCYTELIRGIDAARIEMGVRHLDFEVLCGMAQGHWGKASGLLQIKKLGIEKVFDALRGAGLRIRLEVDPEQRAKMMARVAENFNPMQQNQARPNNNASPVGTAITSRVFRHYAKKGGKARMAKMSARDRREHQKRAANSRWIKHRKLKALKEKIRTKRAKAKQDQQPRQIDGGAGG